MVHFPYLEIHWTCTLPLVSDSANTKSLGRKQFEYLRDKLTGYALARKRFPEEFGGAHTSTQQLSMAVKTVDMKKGLLLLKGIAKEILAEASLRQS